MEQPVRISEEKALETLSTFCDDKQSVVLATVNEKGEPFVSYSPYVEDDEHNYYIYISAYVPHAHNLAMTKKASVMVIEDESVCKHIYGRQRFYFQAEVEKFDENDSRTESINELFSKRFGSKVSFVEKMPDFRIYKLIPKEGNLVLGFGSAYSISKDRKSIKIKNAVHEEKHEDHL